MADEKIISEQLRKRRAAYAQLEAGAKSLLELNTVYWTEKYLLRLALGIARQRLKDFAG